MWGRLRSGGFAPLNPRLWKTTPAGCGNRPGGPSIPARRDGWGHPDVPRSEFGISRLNVGIRRESVAEHSPAPLGAPAKRRHGSRRRWRLRRRPNAHPDRSKVRSKRSPSAFSTPAGPAPMNPAARTRRNRQSEIGNHGCHIVTSAKKRNLRNEPISQRQFKNCRGEVRRAGQSEPRVITSGQTAAKPGPLLVCRSSGQSTIGNRQSAIPHPLPHGRGSDGPVACAPGSDCAAHEGRHSRVLRPCAVRRLIRILRRKLGTATRSA